MSLLALSRSACAILDSKAGESSEFATPLPGLHLLRHTVPTDMTPTLYEPVLCLILQGRKVETLGANTVKLGPGQLLIVSHDLPVVTRITRARPAEPYLALIMEIDVSVLRSLYEEVGSTLAPDQHAASLTASDVSPEMLDALDRYLRLARRPLDLAALGPLLQREIHFRLLTAPNGGMLRRLLRHDTHASHIARAIGVIREDFRLPIAVTDLARRVGMSPSSLHRHFRDLTSTTPLQYQKELRLLEARRLLQAGGHSVTTVAFDVGYESPNQFSREYARKFGAPPRTHRVRTTAVAAGS